MPSITERAGIVDEVSSEPGVGSVPMLLPPGEAAVFALELVGVETGPLVTVPAEGAAPPEVAVWANAPPTQVPPESAVRIRKVLVFMALSLRSCCALTRRLSRRRIRGVPPLRQTDAKDVCAGWGICLSGALSA